MLRQPHLRPSMLWGERDLELGSAAGISFHARGWGAPAINPGAQCCCSCSGDPGRVGCGETGEWLRSWHGQLLELSCGTGALQWLLPLLTRCVMERPHPEGVSSLEFGGMSLCPAGRSQAFMGTGYLVVIVSISSELTLNILCFKKLPSHSPVLALTRTLHFKGAHL